MSTENPAKRARPASSVSTSQVAGAGAGAGAGAAAEAGAAEAHAWQTTVEEWAGQEALAEAMIPIIGSLYRTHNVVTTMFGRGIVNKSVIDILKAHSYGRKHHHEAIHPAASLTILRSFASCEISGSTRLDLGKTTVLLQDLLNKDGSAKDAAALKARLQETLTEAQRVAPCLNAMTKPRDVVLYGFGRIGRLLARILVEKTGGGGKIALRAVVVRPKAKADIVRRASLLRRDSVHGPFNGILRIDAEEGVMYANGTRIKIIYADKPDQIDYTAYGIDDCVVLDNTGIWRKEEGMRLHLKSKGVSKVVLTAPASGGNVTTVVAGINDDRISPDTHLYSAASCTTNAIVPVLSVLDAAFGVQEGHIETVHSFTNDQNLIDNYHAKSRRGRSAVLNMVITETGAGAAVSQALPQLEGKLTANAIRVPTPDVSLAIMSLTFDREITAEEVNKKLLDASLSGPLQNQIDYFSSPEVVSTDFVGNRFASIIDSTSTLVHGKRANVYVWYDNEFGYSCQVVRLVQRICGIVPTHFPPAVAK